MRCSVNIRVEVLFLLSHLEDFGIPDKSELDIVIWNQDYVIPIEVKGFPDANSPDVKREIIRNCFRVEDIQRSKVIFPKTAKIIPLLLYSESFHRWKHKKNQFDYFNSAFLKTSGENQKGVLSNFDRGNYKIPDHYIKDDLPSRIEALSKLLRFLSWEDILDAYKHFNGSGRFDAVIEELSSIRDYHQDPNGILLISMEEL